MAWAVVVVPEQFLQSGGVHCPAERALPVGDAVAKTVVWEVEITYTQMPGLEFSQLDGSRQ